MAMEEHGVLDSLLSPLLMTQYRKADAVESSVRGRKFIWKLVTSKRQMMLRQSALHP